MGADTTTAERAVNVARVPNLSPFRYPGGKTWLAPTVGQWISERRPELFLEPFAGGAAVGLYIATHDLADQVLLVELDDAIAAVWQTTLEDRGIGFNRLLARIEAFTPTPDSVREVAAQRPRSVADLAFQTIVRNRAIAWPHTFDNTSEHRRARPWRGTTLVPGHHRQPAAAHPHPPQSAAVPPRGRT